MTKAAMNILNTCFDGSKVSFILGTWVSRHICVYMYMCTCVCVYVCLALLDTAKQFFKGVIEFSFLPAM